VYVANDFYEVDSDVLTLSIQLIYLVMVNAFDMKSTNQNHRIEEDCRITIVLFPVLMWTQFKVQDNQLFFWQQQDETEMMIMTI
jgi:hypothetical protein